MREVTGLARRIAFSWRGDLLLALVMVGWALVLCAGAARQGQHWDLMVFVLPYSAALAIRRRWPVLAAALAVAALLAVRPLGRAGTVSNSLSFPLCWTAFLLCYTLGADTALAAGLAGAVLIAAALQFDSWPFTPVVAMITLGPWLAGRIMRSRRDLTEQLQARNRELEAEQERFARESVRYERARISRELHDIVAHCLSVMVVQASAGQRVADSDRDSMVEALTSVREAAAQAQEEIGRLVDLLGGEIPTGISPNLEMVSELVSRAATTGLQVTCRFAGSFDDLSPAASAVAYRVVQEALTNALKHAPGAPVTVTVSATGTGLAVSVLNAAAKEPPSGLEQAGAHYGLSAMRERVAACGGILSAGPAPAGGWEVRAVLPARIPQAS